MKLSKVLDAIQEEFKKPLPAPRVVQPKKRKRKMAKKAKHDRDDEDEDLDEGAEDEGADDEGDEEEAPKPKKKAKKDKAGKKDKGKKKAAKSDGDEGFVTLQDLADEAEIEPQSARVKLREAELSKPEGGRWRWKEGSKDLKAARKAVGL